MRNAKNAEKFGGLRINPYLCKQKGERNEQKV